MNKPDIKQLSGLEKINILQALSIGPEELKIALGEINGNDLILARKLVNDLIIEYLGSNEETKVTSGELQKTWTPVSQFYSSIGCKLSLEECITDKCFTIDPQCFNRKLSGQIQNMLVYFEAKRKIIDG